MLKSPRLTVLSPLQSPAFCTPISTCMVAAPARVRVPVGPSIQLVVRRNPHPLSVPALPPMLSVTRSFHVPEGSCPAIDDSRIVGVYTPPLGGQAAFTVNNSSPGKGSLRVKFVLPD